MRSGQAHVCFPVAGVSVEEVTGRGHAGWLKGCVPSSEVWTPCDSTAATEPVCVLGRSLAEKTGGQSWCPEHSRPWEGQGADRALTGRGDEGPPLWPSRVQCSCPAQKHSEWGLIQELGGHQMARARRSAVHPALGARGPGLQS